ncbi:hypothetical protein STEG23_037965 [Scotinomys teguina]
MKYDKTSQCRVHQLPMVDDSRCMSDNALPPESPVDLHCGDDADDAQCGADSLSMVKNGEDAAHEDSGKRDGEVSGEEEDSEDEDGEDATHQDRRDGGEDPDEIVPILIAAKLTAWNDK